MAATTTTTVCGVRARPLAPPPVQVPPLPTTVGPLVPMRISPGAVPPGVVPLAYVPPPAAVPQVTPTNAGGARPLVPLAPPPLYMLPLKSIPGQPWYAPLQQMYGPGWTPTNPNPTTTWLFDEDGDAYPAGGQPLPREEKKRRRPPSPQELPPAPVSPRWRQTQQGAPPASSPRVTSPRKRPREAVVHDDMRRPAEIAAAAAAGSARPLTTAQALAQKLMAPPSKQPRGQQPRGQARRWTDEEHEEFLAAVGRFGKRWKTVAEHVPSKTAAQVRTHATKYFSKLKERQDLSDPAAMLLQLAAASPAKCAA